MSDKMNRRIFLKKGVQLTGGLISTAVGGSILSCTGDDPNYSGDQSGTAGGDGTAILPKFVVGGFNGQRWRSKDGTVGSWVNSHYSGLSIYGVVYANNRWFTAGENGSILSSVDGYFWENIATLGTLFRGITYGGGRFVAVGPVNKSSANSEVYWSLAGTKGSWIKSSGAVPFGNRSLWGVAYGNGRYVAVGERLGGATSMFSSLDAEYWVDSTPTSNWSWLGGVVFDGSQFVVTGRGGYTYWSTNGGIDDFGVAQPTSWNTNVVAGGDFRGIAYGNGRYIVAGDNGGGSAMVRYFDDPAGTHTDVNLGGAYLRGITYGDGVFVAVGIMGAGWASTDNGLTWTNLSLTGTLGYDNYCIAFKS